MGIFEIVDVIIICSYFFLMLCFFLFTMSQEIRSRLYRLEVLFYHKVLRKKTVQYRGFVKSSNNPKSLEKRRRVAVDYLVNKHFEYKEREEEYLRRLENYGKLRRWLHIRYTSLRRRFTFTLDTIIKPSILIALTYSTVLSVWIGSRFGSGITKLTITYIPNPLNYIFDILILFPIGFSPALLSIYLNYYLQKQLLKRELEYYGIKI